MVLKHGTIILTAYFQNGFVDPNGMAVHLETNICCVLLDKTTELFKQIVT